MARTCKACVSRLHGLEACRSRSRRARRANSMTNDQQARLTKLVQRGLPVHPQPSVDVHAHRVEDSHSSPGDSPFQHVHNSTLQPHVFCLHR